MIDRAATALMKPAIDALARRLAAAGIGADTVTWAGFAIGIAAAVAIAIGAPLVGLALIAASRLADGLDGAVARLSRPTDRGAFLDIVLDFVFYAAVPLAFAVAEPAAHALPAAVLLASFMGTGASFLAFAVMAERRGMHRTAGAGPGARPTPRGEPSSPAEPDLPESNAYPNKGLYYLGGLTEAGETLICFALMCLWPALFTWWAYGFAAMCAVTAVSRIVAGWQLLQPAHEEERR